MSGSIIVETERLVIREFVEEDAAAFHAFNSDPRVMRLTGEARTPSVDEARRMIRDYPDYRTHGYGRWAVVYKAEQRVIGFNGLKYLDDLGEVDLGYRFLVDFWGRGIATESSLAILRYGLEQLSLDHVIGLVFPENEASVRVLQKVGMRCVGMIPYCGGNVQKWVVHRSDPLGGSLEDRREPG